jgi:hypothetical protein
MVTVGYARFVIHAMFPVVVTEIQTKLLRYPAAVEIASWT